MFSFLLCGCGSDAQELISNFDTPQNYGVSAFALSHETWNCWQWMDAMDRLPEWRIATLWGTFGNWSDCLEATLKNPKLKAIEVHLINEPCDYNNRCEPQEYLYGISIERYNEILERQPFIEIMQLHDYQKRIRDWLLPKLQNETACYISPGLESNVHSFTAIKNLLELTRSVWGDRCKIVWNPKGTVNHNLPADVFEYHGIAANTAAPCIRNLDGNDIEIGIPSNAAMDNIHPESVPDWLALGDKCELNFIWSRESNCLDKGTWKPPLERNCNSSRWPDLIGLLTKNPDSVKDD